MSAVHQAEGRAATAPAGFWQAEYTAKKGSVALALYRKRASAPRPGEMPLPVLFLVHGSSISAMSAFDLSVPGGDEYSLMNVFAGFGFDVWTMDHENYGRSSRTEGNSDIASGVADLIAGTGLAARETGQGRMHPRRHDPDRHLSRHDREFTGRRSRKGAGAGHDHPRRA
jgi:hypothetical protein